MADVGSKRVEAPAPHEVSADAPCEIVEGDLADTPEARVVNGAVQRQGCKPIGRGQTTLRLCCPLERDAATCQDYHETRPHLLRVADDSHVLRWLLDLGRERFVHIRKVRLGDVDPARSVGSSEADLGHKGCYRFAILLALYDVTIPPFRVLMIKAHPDLFVP